MIELSEVGRVLSADNTGALRRVLQQIQTAVDGIEALIQKASGGTVTDNDAQESLREAEAASSELRDLIEAELSHDQTRSAVSDALTQAHPEANYVYPMEMYPSHVIYRHTAKGALSQSGMASEGERTMMRRSYAIDPETQKVTLGDASKVRQVTSYEPVKESTRDPLAERDFSADQRKALAKSGAAMSDGSFPIEDASDLENAVRAIGRASDPAAAKAHIVKRAKALKATDKLPKGWPGSTAQESDRSDLVGDLVPLVEAAVGKDGLVPIKVISPGWGASGHYSAAVLKRDGPRVFKAGTHMYLDHPSVSEARDRPERSVRDLAGVLESDAAWQDHGAAGPGLYASARVRADYAPLINDLAKHIGVSIRAEGLVNKKGEADGKKGNVVEAITSGKSVDFVTLPGRGGAVLELMEAARTSGTATEEGEDDMADLAEAQKALSEAQTALEAERTARARAEERLLLNEAERFVRGKLAEAEDLPPITRTRLQRSLAGDPPVKEGALDEAALTTRIEAAIKEETAYLAEVRGAGRVRGMGGATANGSVTKEQTETKLFDSLKRLGLSESGAKAAAAGRR